jgi:hypothetical protein
MRCLGFCIVIGPVCRPGAPLLRAGAYGPPGRGLLRGGIGACPAGARDWPGLEGAAGRSRPRSKDTRGPPGRRKGATLGQHVNFAGVSSDRRVKAQRRHGDRGRVLGPLREPAPPRPGGLPCSRCHAACSSRRSSRRRCPRVYVQMRARGGTERSPGRSLKVTTVTATATVGRSRRPTAAARSRSVWPLLQARCERCPLR